MGGSSRGPGVVRFENHEAGPKRVGDGPVVCEADSFYRNIHMAQARIKRQNKSGTSSGKKMFGNCGGR